MKLNIKETYLVGALVVIGTSMHFWGSQEVLDAKFFYTAEQANAFLINLSLPQRQAYLLNEGLDLLFLSTYSLLFFFLARGSRIRSAWIAFVPGVFDLLETATILLLLNEKISSAPIWLGYATCLKWSTGAVVVGMILFRFLKNARGSNSK